MAPVSRSTAPRQFPLHPYSMSQIATNRGSAVDERVRSVPDGDDGRVSRVFGRAKHPNHRALGGVTQMSTNAARSMNDTVRNGSGGVRHGSARLADILDGRAERLSNCVRCRLSYVASGSDDVVLDRVNHPRLSYWYN
jgi:hypothetical protein